MNNVLELKDFAVFINSNIVLQNINFELPHGKNLVLSGKNGSGKSTLAKAIAGLNTDFSGQILFDDEDISALSIAERAQKGIFLCYQEPVEISGLSYAEMLRAALKARKKKVSMQDFRLKIAQSLEKLELDPFFAQKKIASDLSGGEKKKMEVLQILVLQPKLVILDEIDSGLDKKSALLISKVLRDYQVETGASFIVISHNNLILDALPQDMKFTISNKTLVGCADE